jgi:hypothetical protein
MRKALTLSPASRWVATNLKTDAPGFKPSSRADLAVDLDSHVEVDLSLELAERLEQVNGN